MGIDLGDLVTREPSNLQAWKGKRVALDAWNVLYQFLTSVRGRDGRPLTDEQGRITSHLSGVLQRSVSLVEAGITPIWVFDGKPHPLKAETLAARKARRDAAQEAYEKALDEGDHETARSQGAQAARMSWDMAEEARELVEALGIPTVQAPMEGEAQAAWMAKQGLVDAAASQDFDTLLFGAPILVRNLTMTGRRKLPGKQAFTDITPEKLQLDRVYADTGLSHAQLLDVAILVGTDFNPGVKGIGPKKALKLISEHGDLERLLAAASPDAKTSMMRAVHAHQDALEDRDAIRELFANPPHVDVDSVEVQAPNRAKVQEILVQRHGFQASRVDGAVDRLKECMQAKKQTTLFGF